MRACQASGVDWDGTRAQHGFQVASGIAPSVAVAHSDGHNLDQGLVQDHVWSRNRTAAIKQRLSISPREGLEQTGDTAADFSRVISETVDCATDRVVTDLMRQVRRSENLLQYLEGKRI
jgi:hypothetical protein